jgi:carboxyl-terminal processing protease
VSRSRIVILGALGAAALGAASFVAGDRLGSGRDVSPALEPLVRAAEDVLSRADSPVSEEELVRAAIRGMLEALDDPYAAYLDADRAREERDLATGSTVGVGVWVRGSAEGLVVASVVPGSPAARAGIGAGDVIVEVDGRPVGVDVERAAGILSGPEGTSVTLVVRSGDDSSTVRLTRVRVSLAQVEARMLDQRVAYARVSQFASGVTGSLRSELEQLLGQGARGVVLDLRGNAGGLAEEAAGTAGLFLEGVVAVITREGGDEELEAEGPPLPPTPVVVVVDGGTAGAAELVAGALQDRDRGLVVGTPTFGKGAVLAIRDVGGGEAIRFSTAEFLTAGGHPVEGRGIVPDIPILPAGPGDAQLDRAVRAVLEQAAP